MSISNKVLNDGLRAKYVDILKEWLTDAMEDVLVTGTNELCIPCVDAEGNDKWVQFVVKVPNGTKDEDFDGYARAEDFKMKCEEKQAKAEELTRKKAEKIAKDTEKRKKKEVSST